MSKVRKPVALALAGLMLCGLLPASALAAEPETDAREITDNLLGSFNTDFEGLDSSGKFYWWADGDWDGDGIAAVTYGEDDAKPASGGGSYYIRVTPDDDQGAAQFNTADLAATILPGKTYEFTFWARAETGTGTISLEVNSHDSSWGSFQNGAVTYDSANDVNADGWTLISGEVAMPENSGHEEIQIKLSGSSGLTFCVDDLRLGAADDGDLAAQPELGEELVVNGNFSADNLDVWRNQVWNPATLSSGTVSDGEAIGDSGITTYGVISGREGTSEDNGGRYICFAQDMLGKIQSGHTYEYSFWAKLDETDYASADADHRMVSFNPCAKAGTTEYWWGSYSSGVLDSSSIKAVVPGEWTYFSGTFRPAFDGEATELKIRIMEQGSDNGNNADSVLGDIYVTGVSLKEVVTQSREIEEDIPNLKDYISSSDGIGEDAYTGTSISHEELSDEALVALTEKHFNAITIGNELKLDSLLNYNNSSSANIEFMEETWTRANGDTVTGSYPTLDFSRAKKILDVVRAWNSENPDDYIRIRGHVLVWHSQAPEWFFHENWDASEPYVSAEEMDIRQEWLIRTVLTEIVGEDSEYRDMFYGWDVVNEAVSDAGGYRTDTDDTPSSWWAVYQNTDFIVNAFRYANYYAPETLELYYNDYNECSGAKVESIAELLRLVKSHETDGTLPTRITGMGMQAHHEIGSPTAEQIRTAAITYGQIVGKIQLTESDLKASKDYDGTDAAREAEYTKQAYRYKEIYDVMREVDAMEGIDVNGITFWGLIDCNSWLQSQNSAGGGSDGSQPHVPLLFDDDCKAKPAFWAFVDPDRLEPYINNVTVMQAIGGDEPCITGETYEIDGADASFQIVWNETELKIRVTVEDAAAEATDGVTLYLDWDGTITSTAISRADAAATDQGYTAEFTVSHSLAVDDTFRFDIVVTDGGTKAAFNDLRMTQETSSQYYAKAVTKPYIAIGKGTITVDGEPDDAWSAADNVGLKVQGSSPASTATAKVLWDENNLYVWMEVRDSVLDKSSSNTYEQDSVEVFIDENNGKTDSYETDDKQYRISFENDLDFNGAQCNAENMQSVTRKTDEGYIVEAAFKWTDITPGAGDEIGFDLQVNDAENGVRIGTLNWYDESGQGWSAPRVFGTALLTENEAEASAPGSSSGTSTSDCGVTTSASGSSTKTTATPSASADGDSASSTVSESMGAEIVSQAEENGSDLVVIAPEMSDAVTSAQVTIPGSTLSELGDRTDADVTVRTPAGSVTLPNEALGELGSAGNNVTVSVESAEDAVCVDVKVDGEIVTDVTGGIRAALPAESGQVAVLVDEDGNETILRKSLVEDGTAYILLDGSARVKIVDNGEEFDDVDGEWYAGAVEFVSSHELFQGTGDTVFSPEGDMSRAMLASVLWRLESEAGAGENAADFTDVAGDAWYARAVAWASSHGIIQGVGNNSFDPDGSVTREQMATMLYRYAVSSGMDTTERADLGVFGDGGKVSAWAEDAMEWAVAVGLMKGNGSALDASGIASRAQVATILERMVALMVK